MNCPYRMIMSASYNKPIREREDSRTALKMSCLRAPNKTSIVAKTHNPKEFKAYVSKSAEACSG